MKVLSQTLVILISKNGHIHHEGIEERANALATDLTNGCMMMLYCRLCFLHIQDSDTCGRFWRMPRIPNNFEVPTPYAIAFQKLGVFRVRSLPTEIELVPIVTADHALNFCQCTQPLSLPMYEAAVEVAKGLGMRFNSINQSVKLGSAWWMLKPVEEGDNFQLQCCIPEDKYEDAAIRCLWCIDSADGLNNEFADLSAYPNCYGFMVRNPYPHVAVTYFMGIMKEP